MVFGNPTDFAIEAETDALAGASRGTVWGRMRIWCCGTPVGDFEEAHSGLSDAHQSLMELASDLALLQNPALAHLSDVEVWGLINTALYVDDGRTLQQIQRDSETWSRFNFLTNWGEPFDRYCGVIFKNAPDHLRILIRGSDDAVNGLSVTTFGFRGAVLAFDEWCRAQTAAA